MLCQLLAMVEVRKFKVERLVFLEPQYNVVGCLRRENFDHEFVVNCLYMHGSKILTSSGLYHTVLYLHTCMHAKPFYCVVTCMVHVGLELCSWWY